MSFTFYGCFVWGAGKQHKKGDAKDKTKEEFVLSHPGTPPISRDFTLPRQGASEGLREEGGGGDPLPNFVDRYNKQKLDWAEQVASLGGPNPLLFLKDDEQSLLELSASHPGGLPQFISGNTVTLSQLIRDDRSLHRAKGQAARVTDKSIEMRAMRDIDTVHLAIGIAKWDFEGESFVAPVLLRPLAIRRYGSDFQLKLKDSVFFNPALIRVLRKQFGITISAEEYAELSQKSGVFKPQPVIDKLRRASAGVAGFVVQPRLVVSTFSDLAHEMHQDLDNLDNVFLETIAGSLVAKDRLRASIRDLSPYEGRDSQVNDNFLYSTDTQQEEVLQQINARNSIVVQTLPGTGGTQTVVNAVGSLVASGKRVLVVSPRRATLEHLSHRLRRSGLAGLAIRPAMLRRNLVESIGRSEKVGDGIDAEVEAALLRLRKVLQDYRRSLVMADQKLGVSPLEALHVLSSLTRERVPPTTTVRLSKNALESLALDRSAALEALVEVARLGQFEYGPQDSPWYNVSFDSSEEALKMHQVAINLAETHLPRLTSKASDVISQTPMRPYATIAELGVYLRLLSGVKETLDRFLPAVFDRSLTEVIAAHAPRGSDDMSASNRRRLKKLAKEYVRPGVAVDDMYSRLVQIQQQRVLWQRYSSVVGARPEVPVGISELVSMYQGVYQDIDDLDATLDPEQTGVRLRNMPFSELAVLINDLAKDTDVLHGIHERTALVQQLRDADLGDLLDDLSARHVPIATVMNELEQAWWQSALEYMLQKNTKLLGANTTVVERLEADFRLVDDAHSRANGPSLARELSKMWQVSLRDHPGEAADLRSMLRGSDTKLTELIDKTPNLLNSLGRVFALSPYDVPKLPRSLRFDAVVLVDASALSTAEALGAITRAPQVIAFGDPVVQRPEPFAIGAGESEPQHHESPLSVFEQLAEILPLFRLTQSYRAGGADLLELVNSRFYDDEIVSLPWVGTFLGESSIERVHVEGAKGLPDPVTGAVETTEAEVDRVLELVLDHASNHPNESLMVLTITQKHASRLQQAITAAHTRYKELKDFLLNEQAEPFTVLTIEKAAAQSRDHVIFSIGYGKTPHGMVLSSFGKLSEKDSEYMVASAMTRARKKMTIVSSFTADELDPTRVRYGAAELREVLVERDYAKVSTVLPEEIDPLLKELAAHLKQLGLRVELDYQGMIPLVASFADKAVAIDIDSQIKGRSLRETLRLRPIMLRRLGWQYQRVHSFDLFADPGEVALRIAHTLGYDEKVRAASLDTEAYDFSEENLVADSGPYREEPGAEGSISSGSEAELTDSEGLGFDERGSEGSDSGGSDSEGSGAEGLGVEDLGSEDLGSDDPVFDHSSTAQFAADDSASVVRESAVPESDEADLAESDSDEPDSDEPDSDEAPSEMWRLDFDDRANELDQSETSETSLLNNDSREDSEIEPPQGSEQTFSSNNWNSEHEESSTQAEAPVSTRESRRVTRPAPEGSDEHPADHALTTLAEEDKDRSWQTETSSNDQLLLDEQPPHWGKHD